MSRLKGADLGLIAGTQSTTGLGLPTTTGRTTGDLHYDTLAGREYVLVAGAWSVASGAVNTVAAGLPPFVGRAAGDHAYDSTAAKDYVLTGAAGGSVSDGFGRADAASLIGSTTESGAKTWLVDASAGGQPRIAGNKIKRPSAGTSGYAFLNIGTTGSRTIAAEITMHTGAGTQAFWLNVAAANSGVTSGYYITFDKTSISIFKYVAGTPTITTYNYGTALASGDTATYAAEFNTVTGILSVSRNGVVLNSITDASPGVIATTNTFVGVRVEDNGGDTAAMDAVTVQSLGTLAWALTTPAVAAATTLRNAWVSSATYAAQEIVSRSYGLYAALQSGTNQDPVAGSPATTTQGTNGSLTTTTGAVNGGGAFLYQSFTTGATGAVVNGVTVQLTGAIANKSMRVGLQGAVGAQYDELKYIAQSSFTSVPTGTGAVSFFFPQAVTLLPNTVYSIVMENQPYETTTNAGVNAVAYYNAAGSGGTGCVASIGAAGYATTNGISWTTLTSPINIPFRLLCTYWTKIGNIAASESVNAIGASGGTFPIVDPEYRSFNRVTATGNNTLTFPTAVEGKSFTVTVLQDATGSRTITWPANVKWPGGTAPTLTTTANKEDVFTFLCVDGVNWLGFVAGQNY